MPPATNRRGGPPGDEGRTRLAGLTVSREPPAGALGAACAGFEGRLPPRYATDTWNMRFDAEVKAHAVDGVEILDVGAGAHPVLARGSRPGGCTYVGLDVAAEELAKAPAGSYDDTVVTDVTRLEPDLVGRFDLALSWMVLEHVESLPAALENLRAYLRPGGRLIAQMPGALSLAAVTNRLVPTAIARRILGRIQRRDPATIFPARYDRCRFGALERLLRDRWTSWRVLPLYTGVFYTSFSPVLRAPYLAYEELAYRRGWHDLAPYYLITAAAPETAGAPPAG